MGDVILAADGLYKRRKKRPVLDGLSFQLRRGGLYGLVGAKGSGKSTALRAILGLIHLNDGTVTWNIPRSDVGATIDAPAYHRELSIRGNLVAQANLLKQAPGPLRISSLMQRLKIDEITAGSRSMRNLLTYQTQAAAIAMAMLGHPDLLLLDEPLVALNLECRLAFIELFNEEYRSSGKTALITAESKDDLADLVSDFIHIDGGKNA